VRIDRFYDGRPQSLVLINDDHVWMRDVSIRRSCPRSAIGRDESAMQKRHQVLRNQAESDATFAKVPCIQGDLLGVLPQCVRKLTRFMMPES
jgi:hypothetical protein